METSYATYVPNHKDFVIRLHALINNLRAERARAREPLEMMRTNQKDTAKVLATLREAFAKTRANELKLETEFALLPANMKAAAIDIEKKFAESHANELETKIALLSANMKAAAIEIIAIEKNLSSFVRVVLLPGVDPSKMTQCQKLTLSFFNGILAKMEKNDELTAKMIEANLDGDSATLVAIVTHFYGEEGCIAFMTQKDKWSTSPFATFEMRGVTYLCFDAVQIPSGTVALPTSHPLYGNQCIVVACDGNDGELRSVVKTYPQGSGVYSSSQIHPMIMQHMAATCLNGMFHPSNAPAVSVQLIFMAAKSHAKKISSAEIKLALDLLGANKQTGEPAKPLTLELFMQIFTESGVWVNIDMLDEEVRSFLEQAILLQSTDSESGTKALLETASILLPKLVAKLAEEKAAKEKAAEVAKERAKLAEETAAKEEAYMATLSPLELDE